MLAVLFCLSWISSDVPAAQVATGFVYEDRDADGVRDPGEPGLADVGVSNGRDVVRTARDGSYRVELGTRGVVFVIKPSGYALPVDENNVPRFSYAHDVDGSPRMRFGGMPATGALPPSIDFGLRRQREPDKFDAVFFGDTQPASMEQVEFVGRDAVSELIGTKAAFGVSLGDVVNDNLSLLPPLVALKGKIGVPWFYVVGNHDIDFDTPGDERSTDTWRRLLGAPYYAFNYGRVHFIVLENIKYQGRMRYTSWLGPDQLEFVRQNLALVPKDRLVVLLMHIPLVELEERKALFDLLKDRRHTVSFSAHYHMQFHVFFGREQGWEGPGEHHHLVTGTVSGSWWRGERDELGIPHTTMRDGAPRGYLIVSFDRDQYSFRYKPTRRSADYQMNIWLPQEVKPGESEVVANVFAASPKDTVEMRVGDGPWLAMRRDERVCPFYAALKALEAEKKTPATGTQLPGAEVSRHIWVGTLPAGLAAGAHEVSVRWRDLWGRWSQSSRTFRVGSGG